MSSRALHLAELLVLADLIVSHHLALVVHHPAPLARGVAPALLLLVLLLLARNVELHPLLLLLALVERNLVHLPARLTKRTNGSRIANEPLWCISYRLQMFM